MICTTACVNLLFGDFCHRTFCRVLGICYHDLYSITKHNILRMQAKNAATYYQCWVGARVFDFLNNYWFQCFVSG